MCDSQNCMRAINEKYFRSKIHGEFIRIAKKNRFFPGFLFELTRSQRKHSEFQNNFALGERRENGTKKYTCGGKKQMYLLNCLVVA